PAPGSRSGVDGVARAEVRHPANLSTMPVATLAPDKFRGTLSASDAADAMARGVRTAGFDDVRVLPLADGGDGTLDALLAAGGGLGAVEMLGWSLAGADVIVACDVTTRFADAARVYAPQKGASDAEVQLLTRRLVRLAEQYVSRTGVDVREVDGGGAAGGLAGGLAAI